MVFLLDLCWFGLRFLLELFNSVVEEQVGIFSGVLHYQFIPRFAKK
jgi:hypothetical protein